MKNLLKITVTFCCILLISGIATAQKRTNKINKKIHKGMAKLWPEKKVEEVKLTTNGTYELELFFEANQVHELVENEVTLGYMLLRRGYGCQIGGCGNGDYADGATCSADGGTYETFDYVVFFDKDLAILKMNVVDYPGDYGYEICGKNWLKQFIGYQGKPLRYKSDIDGISGATISANSITSDIQEVHTYMVKLITSQKEALLTRSTAANNSGQK